MTDDFEIIVVNDSSQPLIEADWQKSERVRLINTNRHERSVARNTGAALARGRFLHFLDDDDWLLPGALEDFWTLAHKSDATWLYGDSQLVDRTGEPIIQLHHDLNGNCFTQVLAGEWIPLQASLIDTETFFAVGGFNPLIPGIEDMDLARQLALRYNLASMSAIVACISMGDEGSTTNRFHATEYGRWAREKVLNESGVFARLRTSARSSYWHGRITRAYLTSAVWNLQHKNVFVTASRTIFSLMSFALAGHHIFSRDFWSAVTKHYESEAFLRGFWDAGRPVERRYTPISQ